MSTLLADKQTFYRSTSRLARSLTLRFSTRYHDPNVEPLDRHLHEISTVALREACTVPLHRGVQPPRPIDDDDFALAVGVTELKNSFIDFDVARHIPMSFYKLWKRRAGLQQDDLLIASTGATIGKVDIFTDVDVPVLVNNHVAVVRLDQNRFNPIFVLGVLRHQLFQFQVERDRSGSGQPEIYPDELGAMRIPLLPREVQDNVAEQIVAIETNIVTARERLRRPVDVINEILCEAFYYPLAEHIARERETQFNRRLSDFSHALSLRGSARFHNPDGALIDTFFSKTPHEPLKNYIAVPIRLGATLTQGDLDEDGEAYCVHASAIRREEGIDPQNCLRVSLDFYNALRRRFGLRGGDIVMARSGEGTIGKSALFEEQTEEAFLFSDFTMRLRLSDTLSPRFAAHYFRSVMFQQQVEREKRGMGNMTNIFPPQVGAMLIPVAPREMQDELALTTTEALKALQDDRDAIEAGRAEINTLIETALR